MILCGQLLLKRRVPSQIAQINVYSPQSRYIMDVIGHSSALSGRLLRCLSLVHTFHTTYPWKPYPSLFLLIDWKNWHWCLKKHGRCRYYLSLKEHSNAILQNNLQLSSFSCKWLQKQFDSVLHTDGRDSRSQYLMNVMAWNWCDTTDKQWSMVITECQLIFQ